MAEVVRSTSEGYKPPDARDIQQPRAVVMNSLSKRYGKDARLLGEGRGGGVDESKLCGFSYDLFEAIVGLTERQSGALLRYMYADEKR